MAPTGFIRVFYDPITATLISVGISAAGKLLEGFSAAQDAKAEANFAEAQAAQEALARRQELEDFEKEQRRVAARANATLAAQGADLSSGTPLAIAQSRSAETAEGKRRIKQQSNLREQGFRARASNFRRSASVSILGGVLGAAGSIAGGQQSFLRISQTKSATGAA